MPTSRPADSSLPTPAIAEVRYPLPQLLRELELERATGSFGMEKLDQGEIGKLFKARTTPRRVKPRS